MQFVYSCCYTVSPLLDECTVIYCWGHLGDFQCLAMVNSAVNMWTLLYVFFGTYMYSFLLGL